MNSSRENNNRVSPYYLQLGNYYGRPVDTNLAYNYTDGIQIVPVFKGVSYDKPNYNSLTHGAWSTNYPSANTAYIDKDCVDYKIRLDGPQGTYYKQAKSGPTGATGPAGDVKENYKPGTEDSKKPKVVNQQIKLRQ
jgi:hypothetical protein